MHLDLIETEDNRYLQIRKVKKKGEKIWLQLSFILPYDLLVMRTHSNTTTPKL